LRYELLQSDCTEQGFVVAVGASHAAFVPWDRVRYIVTDRRGYFNGLLDTQGKRLRRITTDIGRIGVIFRQLTTNRREYDSVIGPDIPITIQKYIIFNSEILCNVNIARSCGASVGKILPSLGRAARLV
ncbi:hypothetical protein, partial [Burkholderia anthina]|uniref:hypothetical protein n=1 Tax=Burkholderia anthina TaxID=179879 RepID=UPI001ABA5243